MHAFDPDQLQRVNQGNQGMYMFSYRLPCFIPSLFLGPQPLKSSSPEVLKKEKAHTL
jgi:hypothetical protein